MPTRILRPGIRTSDKWNATSYSAQSLYVSILTLVDDFGRYDARVELLHGECRLLRAIAKDRQQMAADASKVTADAVNPTAIASKVTANDSTLTAFASELLATARDLKELADQKLIEIYVVDARPYLQVTNWQERKRASKSRWPEPAGNCQHVDSNCQQPDSNCQQPDSNCPPPTPYALRPTPSAHRPSPNAQRPSPTPSGGEESAVDSDPVEYSEAEADLKKISLEVYNRSIGVWNPDWDSGLRKAMPAEREQWQALKWLYGLPHDHELFSDRNVPGYTQRKATFAGLIQNLDAEQQKSWISQKKYAARSAKRKEDEEPEGYLGMQKQA